MSHPIMTQTIMHFHVGKMLSPICSVGCRIDFSVIQSYVRIIFNYVDVFLIQTEDVSVSFCQFCMSNNYLIIYNPSK